MRAIAWHIYKNVCKLDTHLWCVFLSVYIYNTCVSALLLFPATTHPAALPIRESYFLKWKKLQVILFGVYTLCRYMKCIMQPVPAVRLQQMLGTCHIPIILMLVVHTE